MKHHRLIPISLLIIGIPLALLMAFYLLMNILFPDEQKPDDSSLALPKIEIADQYNAFVEMQKIEDSNSFPAEPDPKLAEAVNDFKANETFATEIISQHADDITLFRQAAGKTDFQDPSFADPGAIDFDTLIIPDYSSYRQAAQVVALEAESKARSGDVDGGLNEALDVVKLSQLMEYDLNPVIGYLVANSIKQTGLTALRQIALNSNITAAQAKDMAQKLLSFNDSRQGQVVALKMEYASLKSYWQKYTRLGPLLGSYSLSFDAATGQENQKDSVWGTFLDYTGLTKFYYHPNQTLRFQYEIINNGVKNYEADCATVDFNPPLTFPKVYPALSWFFTPNAIGKLLISQGEISLGGLPAKRCNESLAVYATQTTLAVRAFEIDNNRLPTSLSELVPKYLEAVPEDPYSGQSLLYSAEQKLIYSVGPNRQDEGGSPASHDWQGLSNPSFSLSQ
ncbi:MAG: hypothetical protein WC528_03525 [Patescibacteria group bacterium]